MASGRLNMCTQMCTNAGRKYVPKKVMRMTAPAMMAEILEELKKEVAAGCVEESPSGRGGYVCGGMRATMRMTRMVTTRETLNLTDRRADIAIGGVVMMRGGTPRSTVTEARARRAASICIEGSAISAGRGREREGTEAKTGTLVALRVTGAPEDAVDTSKVDEAVAVELSNVSCRG